MNHLRHHAAALRVADILAAELAVVWLDRRGAILRAGPGYAALAGDGPVLPRLPAVADRLVAALGAGQAFDAETELRAICGPVPVAVRLVPVVAYPAGVLRLTDLRPVRLLQAQLSQAQALQDVGRLAGGIAHDFNNLLTAILGAAAELPDGGEVELIRASARRGADLVRHIMAFGQQQTLRPRLLAVNDALRGLEDLLGRLLGRGVAVELALEEPGRTILMDPVEFDRVLVNLAVNARDAMRDGGRLTISAGRRLLLAPVKEGAETLPAGRYAVIEVRDTGSGIPPDVLPHIFQPFFTTKRGEGGNGLGLSTVYGIVRQSGGYLAVQSGPGQGTVFRITLPSHKAARAAPPPAALPPPSERAGRRLLLVEDEAPVRLVAARALRRAGWEVREAATGEAALEDVPKGLACVVSDVIMPGMDGPALVRALRAGQPGLKALLISGYANAAQRQVLAAQDIVFLAKPFTPAELVAAVAAHLAAREPAEA